MLRREFRAMNTDCLVLAGADDAAGECDVTRAVQTVHGGCTAGVVALLAYRIAVRQPAASPKVRLETARSG